ncbi:MAG: ankyrin repeat domain-containing protein [Alphaproteobacteria bacterium]
MSLKHPFNDKAFPWRKKKLGALIKADDGEGLTAFLKEFPQAVNWEVVYGPNHHIFLMEAVDDGKYAAAEALLKAGARTDTLAIGGHTALQHALNITGGQNTAASPDQLRMAELLCRHGAAIDGRDTHNRTNLQRACWMGNAEAVKFLMDKGADVAADASRRGMSPLIEVAFGGSCWGEKVNPGRIEAARLLLEAKADPDAENEFGMTALFYAKEKGVIELLFHAGADVTKKDKKGRLCYNDDETEKRALIEALVAERNAQAHRRKIDAIHSEADAACHDGVPAKPARKIVLKNAP